MLGDRRSKYQQMQHATVDELNTDGLLKPNKRNGQVLEPLNGQLGENNRNLSVPRMIDTNPVNIHPITKGPQTTNARGGVKVLDAINHQHHKVQDIITQNAEGKPPIKSSKFRTLEPLHK